MKDYEIQIPVRLNAADFQDFALFDTMSHQKRWVRPVVFAGLLLVFACACFALGRIRAQGALLGLVLTAVGVGLPLVYFFHFFRSVRRRAALLDPAKVVYTVRLGQEGVSWRGADGTAETTPWEQVDSAWRQSGAVYLYVQKNRAYLLPAGQANTGDDHLWAFLCAHLPAGRVHEGRRAQ